MRFHQRAAWVALSIYLCAGFFCVQPLLRLTDCGALVSIRASRPSSGGFSWARAENVPVAVVAVVAALLYVQGFALLLACTRTDARARIAKTVFPFVLCTFWKWLRRKDDVGTMASEGYVEPLVFL
uniref:Putative conserved plasma membrane protein n=1 Tax=Ixodes ricinus TaxID=34613 RepID=A0A131XRU2_IXORI